ncbi:aminotransferase class V-fold PLP-dependent enzyme [Nitrososphaera sp.]|uniref:aminotransferase class V-fold PLP-dependent enzyme n=1 Tax=Nitrososphaera sp. TaxID=1971748 RepID=UPI00307D4062
MTPNAIDFDVRRDFALTKKVTYMNNGATAPTPLAVVKAVTDYMVKCAEEGPDSSPVSEYTTSLLAELRRRVAHLINCEPEEVVLTQSTTDGINMVANGIAWKKGDSVVVRGGSHEHYADYFPWLRLSRDRGVVLSELAIDASGFFDLADLEKATKGSRLVAMSHALYNTGAIMPLEEAGKIARENGALFCVDAAQSAGTIRVDVKRIGCHFMAFPGFKWLCGPTGIGILYCSREASEMLTPQSIGGESAILSGERGEKVLAYMDMPHRLQAGFRNYPGAAGLEAALRYVLRIGIDNIRAQNTKVANALRQELESKTAAVTEFYGPEDGTKRTSIVSFAAKDPAYVVRKLEENGVVLAERDVGGGKKAVRASPHFFNTEEEAARVAALARPLLAPS